MSDYPRLRHLFGAYMHQDMLLEYASLEEAIRDAQNEGEGFCLAAATELDALLEATDDAELRDVTAGLGRDVGPATIDGPTLRAMLVEVRRLLVP